MTAILTPLGGGADDVPQIQAALATESVHLQPGEWTIGVGSAINVPTNRELLGLHPWNTLITVAPGQANFHRPISCENETDILLGNFRIFGNGETADAGEQNHGIWVNDCQRVKVSGVHTSDHQGDCIALFGTTTAALNDITIEHVIGDSGGRAGISWLGSAGSDVVIRNCTMTRQTLLTPTTSHTALLHIEPSNFGLLSRVSIEDITINGSGINVGVSPHATIESRIEDLTMRRIRVYNRRPESGLAIHRGLRVALDDIRIDCELPSASGVLFRDSGGASVVGDSGFLSAKGIHVRGEFSEAGFAVWSSAEVPCKGGVRFTESTCDVQGGAGYGFFFDAGYPSATISDVVARNTGNDSFYFRNIPWIDITKARSVNRAIGKYGYHIRATTPGLPVNERCRAVDSSFDVGAVSTGVLTAGTVAWDGTGITEAPSDQIAWGVGTR